MLSYPDFIKPISLQNVKFSMCIYLLYAFLLTIFIPLSPWYVPYTNGFSNLSVIELCTLQHKFEIYCKLWVLNTIKYINAIISPIASNKQQNTAHTNISESI